MTGTHVFRGLAIAGSLGLFGCPSGYRFTRVSDAPQQVTIDLEQAVHQDAKEAKAQCGHDTRPIIHCDRDASLCNKDFLTKKVRACASLKPIFSFVHLSDSQLKEHQVSIDGTLNEATYDSITNGSARHPALEENDDAVLSALVLGVNYLSSGPPTQVVPGGDCAPDLRPEFAIHTGDSVDAGLFSELFQLLRIMQLLEIPFYNVVGNHDNLFFGTFPKEKMRGLDVALPFVPIGDTQRFIHAHGWLDYQRDISIPYWASSNHRPTELGRPGSRAKSDAFRDLRGSFYHGFDLFCEGPPAEGHFICPEASGYYAFDAPLPGERQLRFLVLNTAEIGAEGVLEGLSRRSLGEMRPEQLEWLKRELSANRAKPTFYIVLGHHNLNGFVDEQENALRSLLINAPRVLAYVDGHTHVNRIQGFERPGAAPFWEITGGSTLVYPQLAQVIELVEDTSEPGSLFLRVRSFGEGLSRASCATTNKLAARARRGREGAYADRSGDGDWRSLKEAVDNSNGLLRVAGP